MSRRNNYLPICACITLESIIAYFHKLVGIQHGMFWFYQGIIVPELDANNFGGVALFVIICEVKGTG